jgi:PmbA protein
MLMNIEAVANDIEVRGSIQTGSVLISEMQIAGN